MDNIIGKKVRITNPDSKHYNKIGVVNGLTTCSELFRVEFVGKIIESALFWYADEVHANEFEIIEEEKKVTTNTDTTATHSLLADILAELKLSNQKQAEQLGRWSVDGTVNTSVTLVPPITQCKRIASDEHTVTIQMTNEEARKICFILHHVTPSSGLDSVKECLDYLAWSDQEHTLVATLSDKSNFIDSESVGLNVQFSVR
jgi:hypothetical protein